jgi:type I restriction enzyme S subunit
MSEWRRMTLGEVCHAGGGFIRTGPFGSQLHQSDYIRDVGGVPVVMPKDIADGRIDMRSVARVDRGTADRLSHQLLEAGDIVLSRRGDVGRSAYVMDTDTPALCGTGSIRIHLGAAGPVRREFLRYYLRSDPATDYLAGHAVGATMPNLNTAIVAGLPVPVPPAAHQAASADILGAVEGLIENNRRRIELLEEMAQAIYREWFVHFRYPGHENVALNDSILGPVPRGWQVKRVAEIASAERNAVTGGPFGSKLGRKDYVAAGVPVLRGSNLRVGGGFDESDLVFVSDAKADELRSSLASRGDVVITQRGTLGQVGLVPRRSKFSRYLLSQSQMKLTVNPSIARHRFVYAQFCAPETTARFVGQAMSSGVPHVNLALLREFAVVVPPVHLQACFADTVEQLADQQWLVREQARQLGAIRDLLLPKLVTGRIDVSKLDLDGLLETVT